MGLQNFRQLISNLWREQAEPYLVDLGPGGPVLQKFPQIAWPLHHLTGDRAVDGNLLARDVLQDAIVGCRGAPDIVLGLQSVNRYDDVHVGKRRPSRRKRPECTGDQLDVNSSIKQQRNHHLELAIADKRVASHDRQMQRLEPVDDLKNTVDQVLPLAIMKTSQSHAATQARVIIGIAPATTQRALARNLNGKRGPLSLENLAPCANNFL